jgi:hypothetical protein
MTVCARLEAAADPTRGVEHAFIRLLKDFQAYKMTNTSRMHAVKSCGVYIRQHDCMYVCMYVYTYVCTHTRTSTLAASHSPVSNFPS